MEKRIDESASLTLPSRLGRALCALALAIAMVPLVGAQQAIAASEQGYIESELQKFEKMSLFDDGDPNTSHVYSIHLKYIPSSEEQNYYSEQDPHSRGTYTVTSSNEDVITCTFENVFDGQTWGFEPHRSGASDVTISYRYEGAYGTYAASRTYHLTVVDTINSVTEIALSPNSVEFQSVGSCPLCGKFHEDVDGRPSVKYSVVKTEDSAIPPTNFWVSGSTDIVSVSGFGGNEELTVSASALGETIVKVAASSSYPDFDAGHEWGSADLAVKVTDAGTPAFSVENKTLRPTYRCAVASLDEDSILVPNTAARAIGSSHRMGNLIESVVSSDESIVSIEKSASTYPSGTVCDYYCRGRGLGTATITINDVFGNIYTAKVSVGNGSVVEDSLFTIRDMVLQMYCGAPAVNVLGNDDYESGMLTPTDKANEIADSYSGYDNLIKSIESSDPSVVRVDNIPHTDNVGTVVNSYHIVGGAKTGQATVTVTDVFDNVYTSTVTMDDGSTIDTSAIKFNESERTLNVGDALKGGDVMGLFSDSRPLSSYQYLSLASSNRDVLEYATDQTGPSLTAKKAGTVTLNLVFTPWSASPTPVQCDTMTVHVVDPDAPSTVPVEGVSLDLSVLTLSSNEHGNSMQLRATVSPDNASNKSITWSSSDEGVVSVDSDGRVTSVGKGTATITATTVDGGKTATCVVTVRTPVDSIEVSPASAQVELKSGETATLALTAEVLPADADDKSLEWSSDNEEVAIVDQNGNVTVKALGRAIIKATAKDGSSMYGTCDLAVVEKVLPATSVSVSGSVSSLKIGETCQLHASVEPKDSTDTVVWSSSDESVLAIDQAGLVTAVGNGTASIKATAGSAVDETPAIEVTTPVASVSLDSGELELYVGADASKLTASVLPVSASNKAVTWASSNTAVVTVDAEGNVKSVAPGSAIVTATTMDGGFTASCKVVVKQHATGVSLDKATADIQGAGSVELKATVEPDNATNKNVIWESDDVSVAVVDGNGRVTSVGKGTAIVTATTEDGEHRASCMVTVANPVTSLSIDPASLGLVKGDEAGLTASLSGTLPGETDGVVVAWSSSDDSVASVNADGAVVAKKTGAATITAKVGEGIVATCSVAVTNPVRTVSITETAKTVTVGDMDSFALSAKADPVDGDGADAIVWASSNESVATVGPDGTVEIKGVGSAFITASAGGKSAACSLAVNPAVIEAETGNSGFVASVEISDPTLAKEMKKAQAEGDLSLVVQRIDKLTGAVKDAVDMLTSSGSSVAESFDVHFVKNDGEEVSINGQGGKTAITVKVKITDAMRALQPDSLKVHFVGDDGVVEDKDTWIEGDYLCFATEHFSTYVVTGKPMVVGDETADESTLKPLDTRRDALAETGDAVAPVAGGIMGVVACCVLGSLVAARRARRW